MMQLKIIRIRGQCRGRPPTTNNSREGPGTESGLQSAVSGLEHGTPARATESIQSGSWNPEPSGVTRRWSDLRSTNSTIVHRNHVFKNSLARDWPGYTCSSIPGIKKNRDKDRWKTTLNLLKMARRGSYDLL